MKYINRFTMLVMGISLLICGVLGHKYLGKGKQASVLQQSYNHEIAMVKESHAQIRKLIEADKPLSFKQFSIPSSYPYFIYDNGKLLYWSSNTYIPSYPKEVASAGEETLFTAGDRPAVLIKTSLAHKGKRYNIVSVIDLFRNENYVSNYRVPDFNTSVFFF